MSAIGSWIWITASAATLGTAASEPALPLASAAAVQSSAYSWDLYKVRLGALARLKGVRETTISTYVPGLSMNSDVISLERTEPVARSSNGVVGVLAPYLERHVTPSLIARGQANYSRITQPYAVSNRATGSIPRC